MSLKSDISSANKIVHRELEESQRQVHAQTRVSLNGYPSIVERERASCSEPLDHAASIAWLGDGRQRSRDKSHESSSPPLLKDGARPAIAKITAARRTGIRRFSIGNRSATSDNGRSHCKDPLCFTSSMTTITRLQTKTLLNAYGSHTRGKPIP